MSTLQICPDHLTARVRSGPLSPSEQQRLDAHLQQCDLCKNAVEFERDFDSVLFARQGDEVIAARLADSVVALSSSHARVVPIASRRVLLPRYLFAAALLALAATAVAGWTVVKARRVQNHSVSRVVVLTPIRVEPTVAPMVPSVPDAAPTAPVVANLMPTEITTSPTQPTLHPTRSAHVGTPVDTRESAADLFAQANASRRSDLAHAQELYLRLQRTYPRSSEALVSRVSLGRILLERVHNPRAALAQFDQYLGQESHTVLSAEALFGRASALLQLGRSADERAAWELLIQRFPDSAYVPRARARLAALH